MKSKSVPLLLVLILLFSVPVSADETSSTSCEIHGESTEDRVGCLDSDGDGWSDPDVNWNISMGADAFPNNASEHSDLDGDGIGDVADEDMDGDLSPDEVDVWPEDSGIWSDTDGDGYADQGSHAKSDNCPFTYGKSRYRLKGCSDIDGDFTPDIYDSDADGDGISNQQEIAASTGTILYDPYNADITPLDFDKDTIPDDLDPDDDNDDWPDDVEIDRGSDKFNKEETPFNLYFNSNTGFFYSGGLSGDSFSSEYDAESIEISLSALSEIVFEELVIPFLLVPIYFAIFFARRGEYKKCLAEIEAAKSLKQLIELESKVNLMVKEKKIKVYHGLVLRNALEENESKYKSLKRFSYEEE
ncbi:MAG: hypothetical protein CMO23_00255 [Thiotrichales bacterium]|nr:hypothetical protein [Thiotrichales bacterium]|tara:strand:- start:2681 stop:3754 length:1074 start_codon:yes stop_codon:yes gene_type:complete